MGNISSLYLRIIVHYDGEYYFIIHEDNSSLKRRKLVHYTGK